MVLKLNHIFMVIRYTALLIALAVVVFFAFFNKAHAFSHPMEVELDHNEVHRQMEEIKWDSEHEISRREWEILTDEKYQKDYDRKEPSHDSD